MASGKEFIGLLPPKETHPRSAFNAGSAPIHNMIRGELTITTWLCLGGIVQGGLCLAAGRFAFVPAVVIVVYKILVAYAQTVGWMRNPEMDNVIMKKFSAQFPDSAGHYGSKPANSEVVVFLIGARCNHPLGMFGPGYKEMGDYFQQMSRDLDKHSDDFGFLGMTSWTNAGDRATGNEVMNVCYFRSVEGLHQFAHADYHRKGWDWWNKGYSKMPHISIWHETYHLPKGSWESIYLNSHSFQGINSTVHKYIDQETGQTMWASPVVDASRGLLKTSAGRMSRSQGGEHEKMGVVDAY